MSESGSLLIVLSDPRLMAHAASDCPAWLWSADATRVLWANPTAAAIFDAPSPAALAGHIIDPKGSAALQIARLAGTLPHGAPPRLERLRGFGGRFGGALMCACSRIMLADHTPAILVVATEPAGPKLTLAGQAKRLLADCDQPLALFAANGALLHATPAAQARIGQAKTLEALGVSLGGDALAAGHAAGESAVGKILLARLGAEASTMLLATFAPRPEASQPAAAPPAAAPVASAPPPPAPPVEAAPPPASQEREANRSECCQQKNPVDK